MPENPLEAIERLETLAAWHRVKRRARRSCDALSVGMFLQTLLLALTERDLGSCVEVSI